MALRVNPFFELYVGDRMSSREFVDLFSPFLVRHAEALFVPGNVVVKGVQGSGKSMLLTLLKPDVRLEYARAGADFPVPAARRRFIGAGINLAHKNAIDFGYRRISDDPAETALFFGDFVNYTVLLDLLRSVEVLGSSPETAADLGIALSPEREEAFAEALASADIMNGALEKSRNFEDLRRKIRDRLNGYRRFLHHNDRELAGGIRESKTDIGTPITTAAQLLKKTGMLADAIAVFVHVDQYEELANIANTEDVSPDYRRVINRALARRDPNVSYRLGTRGHAWRDHGYIHGADAKLEEERDYKYVDLDSMLRRNEDRRTWIFPEFVADVFSRRMGHATLAPKNSDGKKLLASVFGSGIKPDEKARRYGGRSPERSVKADPDWPEPFKQNLSALAREDPLSARLLEAWVLQRLNRLKGKRREDAVRALSMEALEDMQGKEWWRKERTELALIQIAARCQERPIWSGSDDVVQLSGGSILTFLSLCQFIWDTHSQLATSSAAMRSLDEIQTRIQAIGVFKASDHWFKKIATETGRSGDRMRLVRQIGTVLAQQLYSDRTMSYPGHNGFSIANEELEQYRHVAELLEEMSDYGALISDSHTTKEKDRRSRTKFYLNPVLCPMFKIHYKRSKEPKYVEARTVEDWMKEAGLSLPTTYKPRPQPPAEPDVLPLFSTQAH